MASLLVSATARPAAQHVVKQQVQKVQAPLAQERQQQQRAAATFVGLAAAGALLLSPPQAQAVDAAAVFSRSCAGCHAGGGNVIRRDATLQLGDLQKNGLDGVEALYGIIYRGRNSMPGFGQECAPRGACTFGPRLADEDIQQLAAYVLAQAQAGWPTPEQ
ncbi:hypothetical protein ABPG77_001558 [Micractinium sp. CCAP 211/92]